MGDIGTHAHIVHFVKDQVQSIIPTTAIPDADYSYLEFGNYLTDVSQFRDPPAFHRAREEARRAASTRSIFAGLAGRDAWADGMFGRRTGGSRHGWLAEFMRQVICGVTHQIFDPDGLAGIAAIAQNAGLTGPYSIAPIPSADVDRVFNAHFTQYWPHEHLDFPPVTDPVRHWGQPGFQIGNRGLLSYLENYLQFISEELSKLEYDWVIALEAGNVTRVQRQDFLVRLGHLLHAVEDYYFHSNFVEIRQWEMVKARNPAVDPSTDDGHRQLVLQGLVGTDPTPNSVRLRRSLHRRLRYPVFIRGGLSRDTSNDGSGFLYTGGFGQTDVWHTLGGALEALEASMRSMRGAVSGIPGAGGIGDFSSSDLILMRLLFSRDARRDMVANDRLDAHMETHATQLTSGAYDTAIEQQRSEQKLSARAAECLREAFRYDRDREAEYRFFPGPGGVLISMLDLMQRERDANETAAAALDGNAGSITMIRTDNSASAENVGTHSLMSKDSTDKQPLRQDALALANHASAGIAATLANRLVSRRPSTEGIDWDTLVRFYVRFPAYRTRHWEEELITAVRRGSFRQPNVSATVDQPNFRLLGPTFGADKLAARRAGTTKDTLEARYRSFETNP